VDALARVARTVSFADDSGRILEYLVQRTDETVVHRVDGADVVVLGAVVDVETRVVEVPEHALVEVARLAVEERLAGDAPGSSLTLAHARTARGTTPAVPDPSIALGDRGLFFLQELDEGERNGRDVPSPSYRLAALQDFLPFRTEDVDERGRPTIRDETERVEETADAVRWYAGLPDEADGRCAALASAPNHRNPRIAWAAVRSLALSSCPGRAEALAAALEGADEDLQTRIMLGLWISGEHSRSAELLESLQAGHGKDAWLAAWGLAYSVDEAGRRQPVLFGPDPAEAKGD
jgi:hypothetical protein